MIYVCENNLYAASTSAAGTLAHRDVAARAAGYDIRAWLWMGMM